MTVCLFSYGSSWVVQPIVKSSIRLSKVAKNGALAFITASQWPETMDRAVVPNRFDSSSFVAITIFCRVLQLLWPICTRSKSSAGHL